MKTANYIKSLVFLFAILFSFSVSAYNSLNKLSSGNIASLKAAQVDQSSTGGCISDSVFFEEQETEDDSENCDSHTFFVLPYFFQDLTSMPFSRPFILTAVAPSTTQPLFISIRVLRL